MEEALIKRVLPHSVEAEQSVIGAMLMDQEAIIKASEIISGDDFYQHQYGIVFDAIVELYNDGKPVDLITLQNLLREKDVPPEISSLEFVKDLLTSALTSTNADAYAQIVHEKAVLRKLIKVNEQIANDCYSEKEKLEDILESAEKRIFDIVQKRNSGDFVPIKDVVLRALDRIEAASRNKGSVTGIPTGFIDLDYKTTGMQPSDLVLIAARPSMGKTAFVLNIAQYMAFKKNYTAAIFSLEMSKEQLVNRLFALESQVDSQQLRTGNLSDDDWAKLIEGAGIVGRSNLIIDDTPGISVAELRSKCRKYKAEKGLDVIMIDYLQLMTGNQDSKGNREQEVAFISRTLKAIAKELNVPVVCLSQLSRGPESRSDKRPMLSDLRESGAIEQDADIVAFIHRPEYYGINQDENGMPTAGMAEIIIAKHRNGAVCDVNLRFLKEQARFADMDDSMLPPAQASDSQQAYDDYASGSNGATGASAALGSGIGGGEFDLTPRALDDEAPF